MICAAAKERASQYLILARTDIFDKTFDTRMDSYHAELYWEILIKEIPPEFPREARTCIQIHY